jgi:hypothetical protein
LRREKGRREEERTTACCGPVLVVWKGKEGRDNVTYRKRLREMETGGRLYNLTVLKRKLLAVV